MGGPGVSARRRRTGAIAVASLAVAAIAVGAALVELGGDTQRAIAGDRAELSAGVDEPTLDLDLGSVSGEAAVRGCLAPDFAADPSAVEVLYGVRQRTAVDDAPVLLLRNDAGELQTCDMNGPDRPAQLPVPSASAGEPVVFLSNGKTDWQCTDTRLDRFTSTTWLSVAPTVDRVQQRFIVDGRPGRWFTTRAVGGYAHLQTWLDGPVAETSSIEVETRVLNAAGDPVPQSNVPTTADLVPGCTGDDVRIG